MQHGEEHVCRITRNQMSYSLLRRMVVFGNASAFTLMELLVVVVIIGLMASLVGPRLTGHFNSANAKTTVKHVATMLRYARNQALSSSSVQIIEFNSKSGVITLSSAASIINDDEDVSPSDSRSGESEKTYKIPEGIRILNSQPGAGIGNGDSFKIIYYPTGNSTAGQLIIFDAKDRRYIVEIDQVTGEVSISG